MKENTNKFEAEKLYKTYNSTKALKKYSLAIDKVGLWDSEKIIFNKYVEKSSKIIDIGTGAGRTAINLYRMGYKNITAIDNSNILINYAKNFCFENGIDIELKLMNSLNLKFSKSFFDVAFYSFNGIMLMPEYKNRIRILREIRKVLKTNGIFIFTTHDMDSDQQYKDFWLEEQKKWDLNIQNSKLYEFGDLIDSEFDNNDSFVHIPKYDEIKSMLEKEKFDILYTQMRKNICNESEKVKKFSGECRFWVAKKQVYK